VDVYGERDAFTQVEVAKYGGFNFGPGLSKMEGFSLKKRSDRAQVHLFAVGMYQNQVFSDDCCGTPFCGGTALTGRRFTSNFCR